MRLMLMMIATAWLWGCGGTAEQLRSPANLKAERLSPVPPGVLADCIHSAWQARSRAQIGRSPNGPGTSVTIPLPAASIHGLGAMVDVQPAEGGSVARIYYFSHDQRAGEALAACAS